MTDAAGKILTEFNLYFATSSGPLSPSLLEIGGRYARSWQNVNAQDVLTLVGGAWVPPQDWSLVQATADGFRAAHPETKSGLYVGSGVWARATEPAYVFLTYPTDAFHAPTGAPLVYVSPSPAGDVGFRWFNVALAGNRARLAQSYVDFCESEGFDGIFFDSYDPAAHALWVREPYPVGFTGQGGGLLEGPYHTQAAWEEILTLWAPEASAALEASGRRLIINGLAGSGTITTWGGYGNSNLARLASGLMDEAVQHMYKSPALFDEGIRIIRLALELGGEVFCWFQPALLAAGSYSLGTELARFYLATYLLIDAEERTSFGYHPYAAYQGIDAAGQPYIHWEDDWTLEYGHPTGHQVDGGTTTPWWRHFTKGYAVVNPTGVAYTFREPGNFRAWHPTDGPLISIGPSGDSWYQMPPYTGHFLFEVEAA